MLGSMNTRALSVTAIVLIRLIVTLAAQVNFSHNDVSLRERILNYEKTRTELLTREDNVQVGGNLILDGLESQVNEILMSEKLSEHHLGQSNSSGFRPAQNFISVMAEINKTPLFKLLQSMPKGGVLHVHDLALCSSEYLLQLTYADNLWVCAHDLRPDRLMRLQFSRTAPLNEEIGGCAWETLKEMRNRLGADHVNKKLLAQLALQPEDKEASLEQVWERFRGFFRLLYGMLTYVPVFDNYIENAMQEFYADGVQYIELRSTLPILYDMDGNNYTILDTMAHIAQADQRFRAAHSDWLGLKVIYSPSRKVDRVRFQQYKENALNLKAAFPHYFAGFDLVSFEDDGEPLRTFAHDLLAIQEDINFYFHAGETKWYGTSSDENIIDAILLGTKRIGHGLALLKHPQALKLVYEKKIAIELSPISNQMLHYIDDLRNHPNAYLLANDFAVVITSDDPSFWHAAPLTHDFYVTFLGIASRTADLSMLKTLAINSLKYSALPASDRDEAMRKWQTRWRAWLEKVIEAQRNKEKK